MELVGMDECVALFQVLFSFSFLLSCSPWSHMSHLLDRSKNLTFFFAFSDIAGSMMWMKLNKITVIAWHGGMV